MRLDELSRAESEPVGCRFGRLAEDVTRGPRVLATLTRAAGQISRNVAISFLRCGRFGGVWRRLARVGRRRD